MVRKTKYEKQREVTISENNARMESLGLQRLVRSVKDTFQVNKSPSLERNVEDDEEYIPSSEHEDDFSDDSMSSPLKSHQNVRKKTKAVNMDDQGPSSSAPQESKKKRGASKGLKNDGEPMFLEYNELLQPTGQWEKEYGQQIGHCASRVKIYRRRWKDVPASFKEILWADTKVKFHIEDPTGEKEKVFYRAVAARFRARKTKLISRFITNNKDGRQPWEVYKGQITEAEWKAFEEYVTSDEFQQISARGKECAKGNIHRHSMGQKSYGRKRIDWAKEQRLPQYSVDVTSSQSSTLSSIVQNRSLEWCLAHQRPTKDGGWAVPASKPETARVVSQVMEYLSVEDRASTSTSSYGDDALTQALGKKDYRGWVKVLGKGGVGVGHQKAFGKTPRQMESSAVQDYKKVVDDLNQKWEERFQQQQQIIQTLMATMSAQNPSLVSLGMQTPFVRPPMVDEPKKCRLGLYCDVNNPANLQIVAHGSAYPSASDVHGYPVQHEHMKVSIDDVVEDYLHFPLPVPSPDGVTVLGDAVGYFVQWPVSGVALDDQVVPSVLSKASVDSCNLRSEDLQSIYDKFFSAAGDEEEEKAEEAQDECTLLRAALNSGEQFAEFTLHTPYLNNDDPPPFKQLMALGDFGEFCDADQVTSSVMLIFIEYLYTSFLKDDSGPGIHFFNPETTQGAIFVKKLEQMKMVIGRAFCKLIPNQKACKYILYPYAQGGHWVLFAIDINKGVVYHFDSILIRRGERSPWVLWHCYDALNGAYEQYTKSITNKPRTRLLFKNMKSYQQKNEKDCGYYVMRQMFEIVKTYRHSKDKNLDEDYVRDLTTVMPVEQMNEIRENLAHFCRTRHL